MTYQLGRVATWLARKLTGWDSSGLYAARCCCGWVGPPRDDPWAAEVDAVGHEHEKGC